MKDLSFRAPPTAAIALNATTPVGELGAVVWSTTTASKLTWNGAQWVSDKPFDVHCFAPGTLSADQILLRVPLARDVAWPTGFGGSYAMARVVGTGSTVLTIHAGSNSVGALGPGTQIGSITFGAGSATGSFATTGGAAQSLLAGWVLSILGPASADATLADIGIVLAGTRT